MAAETLTQTVVTIYTPESPLRHPLRLLRAMWRDLLASRELAWCLMVRDISAQYRQSAFGILWAFVPPIATAVVFIILNQEGAIKIQSTAVPYPAFVMVGTVLWQLFTDSLYTPLKAMQTGKNLVTKVHFPREAIILSGIGQTLFYAGIRSAILAAVFVVYQVPVGWGLVMSLFLMGLLLLLGVVVGLLLLPWGMLYNDVTAALGTVTSLWFFVTPVVYPPPDRWPYSLLVDLNPVTPLLVGARDLALNGTLTNGLSVAIVSGLTLVALLFMWVLLRVSVPIWIERSG
jgi:lipopolysaccharide transport system permease protein